VATTTERGSAAIPEVTGTIAPTAREALDRAVAELGARKQEWAALPLGARIALVDTLRRGFERVAERWVALALEAKGVDAASPAAGEEWLTGPYIILRNLRLLHRALAEIGRGGRPRIPGEVRTRPDGQVVARVFPTDFSDKVLFRGFTAEVWMEPGVVAESLPDTQALAYRGVGRAGGVALVLGAGNVASIAPQDAIYKLFVEKRVVILKMNPVNEYLGPLIAEACAELVERGFLRVVYGGAAEGSFLCRHPGIDEVHITGSDRSHDAIVYGTGPDGARRKAEDRPLLDKPISSELGNVTPVIVVPGEWSARDIEFHAANVMSQLVYNAGYNCNAIRVLVTWKQWPQREAFLAALRRLFAATSPRRAYYPGSTARLDGFLARHPEAEQFGVRGAGRLPWVLVAGLDPEDPSEICFTTEAFCGLMGETAVGGATVPDYLERAVAFANDTVWGNLAASLIVHPSSLRNPSVREAFERAIAGLRCGTVAVNHWAATGYALSSTPWGAFAGNRPGDVRSGIGVVHNTLMFSRVEKTVVFGPFRVTPLPPWFVTNRNAHVIARRLVAFEARPALGAMLAVVAAALRG
jgi:acyl-CoA reductase-like NAD-dependent aldehyde dehydrogenase